MVEQGYPGGDQSSPGPADPAIQEFLQLVNAKRRSVGCPELKWDNRLAIVALKHSRDMVFRHFFGHTNPDGKDPFERLQESKVVFSAAAENIAFGPKTGRQAFETWLRSPEHRKNMLDCRFTRHGVAYVGDRWTHLLLKPMEEDDLGSGLNGLLLKSPLILDFERTLPPGSDFNIQQVSFQVLISGVIHKKVGVFKCGLRNSAQ